MSSINGHQGVLSASEIEVAIIELELEMEHLQARHQGLFAFANAWAERYDRILATTPEALRPATEQRLHRIGIRWGVAHGVRTTGAFPALEV